MTQPALDIVGVAKQYGGLRPLRLERLTIHAGDQVALVGFDQAAAETMTALVTGAALPDTGGVSLFGRSTSDVQNATEWLSYIDQIGVVTVRSALLESLSVIQNLSMPFTLEIEPPPDDIRTAAGALAREVGISEDAWDQPIARLDRAAQIRVRLARALALEPRLLILEHPNAYVDHAQARAFAADLRALARRRRLATLLVTADADFAAAAATRVLRWEPATGVLHERRGWFFRRGVFS